MLSILTVIAPLFLIIFGTAIFRHFKHVDEHWEQVLNDFALYIGFPALIFSSLAKNPFSLQQEAPLIIANSIFLLSVFALTYLIAKLFHFSEKKEKTWFLGLNWTNFAYLGIPVIIQIYGEKMIQNASLLVSIYLFWLFIVGVGFLEYKTQKDKSTTIKNIILNIIRNPLLLAVIAGIMVATTGLKIPALILKPIEMISASVTPLVLIVIGLFVGKSKIGKLRDWIPVAFFSLLTLIASPALFYFGLKIFGFSPSSFSTSIIEAAMPIGITPFAFADKYGLDKEFAARAIVLSTILAVVTIPFWASLV